jgi:hypothetical protein
MKLLQCNKSEHLNIRVEPTPEKFCVSDVLETVADVQHNYGVMP